MAGSAAARTCAGIGRRLRAVLVFAVAAAAMPAAAADLAALSAAPVAMQAAAGGPAVVVLWTPGCVACRKSLNEIERFATTGGVAVHTVVPDDLRDEAHRMLAQRGLTFTVRGDERRLDAATRRILLDSPLAYAVDRDGRIVASRGGLFRLQMLEALANAAKGVE